MGFVRTCVVGSGGVFRSNCRNLREGYACLLRLGNTGLRVGVRGQPTWHRTVSVEVNANRAENFFSSAPTRDQMGEQFFFTGEWTALMKW